MRRLPVRKRVAVLAVLGAVLIVVSAVLLYLWVALGAEPDYWNAEMARRQQRSGNQEQAVADNAEVRLLPEWSAPIKPGGDGVRTIKASFEEINAWLVAKLDRYLLNQGIRRPKWLRAAMVTHRDGKLVIAADLNHPKRRQIISAFLDFTPSAAEEAPAQLVVDRVIGGNLPIPNPVFVDLVRELADIKDEGVQGMLDAVGEETPIPLAGLPIDRAREAEVLSVAVAEDGVELTVRVRFREAESGE